MKPVARVEILGLHRVPIEVTEWAAAGKPHGPHSQDFDHLWLLEIRIDGVDRPFNPDEYTQRDPKLPEENWQIAYEERFLDEDGLFEVKEAASGSQRVAFFFHYLDRDAAFLTPYGPAPLPAPSPFPQRLRGVVKYFSPC